jgi:hypothetical protein
MEAKTECNSRNKYVLSSPRDGACILAVRAFNYKRHHLIEDLAKAS